MDPSDRERTRRYIARLDAHRSTLASEIEETVALARGLTPEEHDRDAQAVVGAGWRMLQARADRDRVIQWVEPPAPDFERIWRRLVQVRKRART